MAPPVVSLVIRGNCAPFMSPDSENRPRTCTIASTRELERGKFQLMRSALLEVRVLLVFPETVLGFFDPPCIINLSSSSTFFT